MSKSKFTDSEGIIPSFDSQVTPENIVIIKSLNLNGLNDYIGAKYLYEAAYKPDNHIDYTNMRNLFNISRQEYPDDEIDIVLPLYNFDYSVAPMYDSPMKVLDESAIKEYKKRLVKINELIAQRQWFNDLAVVDDLIEEKEFILSELTKAHNRLGNPRYFVTQAIKDRQAVTKAIKFTVEKLRKLDPELGRICDRHLVLTTYVSWRSEPI